MTIKADLAELERQHKAIENEIAEALADTRLALRAYGTRTAATGEFKYP